VQRNGGVIRYRAGAADRRAAVLAVAVGAVLTGALHVDGLADTADGYGAPTRARALEIMQDHQLGTYGVLALVVVIGLRVSLVAALLIHPVSLVYLVAAGALSRAASVGLGVLLPSASAEGMKASVLEGVSVRRVVITIVTAVAIAVLTIRWLALPGALAVAVATLLWGWHCYRRLGGVTGDALGAASEFGEPVILGLGVVVGRSGGAG
jgi:adenosylcobinamide-GDP ribazoletransferase